MKVKGFQVAPADLEGCILDHPAVLDVCVVGVPDEYAGEVPLAFVVPKANVGNTPEAVASFKASVIKVKFHFARGCMTVIEGDFSMWLTTRLHTNTLQVVWRLWTSYLKTLQENCCGEF